MITKKEIERLILHRKKNNLKNHFQTMMNYNSAKFSGDIRNNEILLWKSTSYMRGNYPVFCLTFDTNETLKEISTQRNSFHKISNLIFKCISIVIIASVFIFSDFKPALIQAFVLLIMLFLLFVLLKTILKYESSLLIAEFKDTILNIENSKNPDKKLDKPTVDSTEDFKEKTIAKTFARLLIYPFCLCILYICLAEFIPTGKLKIGVGGIIIVLVYLISDIKILVGKKTKKNNRIN